MASSHTHVLRHANKSGVFPITYAEDPELAQHLAHSRQAMNTNRRIEKVSLNGNRYKKDV